MTHPMDGAVQIDRVGKATRSAHHGIAAGQSIHRAGRRLHPRWRKLKRGPLPHELFQQYKTFDNVRVNLIERNLTLSGAGFQPAGPT